MARLIFRRPKRPASSGDSYKLAFLGWRSQSPTYNMFLSPVLCAGRVRETDDLPDADVELFIFNPDIHIKISIESWLCFNEAFDPRRSIAPHAPRQDTGLLMVISFRFHIEECVSRFPDALASRLWLDRGMRSRL